MTKFVQNEAYPEHLMPPPYELTLMSLVGMDRVRPAG